MTCAAASGNCAETTAFHRASTGAVNRTTAATTIAVATASTMQARVLTRHEDWRFHDSSAAAASTSAPPYASVGAPGRRSSYSRAGGIDKTAVAETATSQA